MIIILQKKIDKKILKKLCDLYFSTMVKFVVDIEQNLVAVGGELHSDAEAELIKSGSVQDNLWGANFYPYRDAEDYTSLINIRPRQGNMGMEVGDQRLRMKIKEMAEELLLGDNENLA